MEKITLDEQARRDIDAYADYVYHGGDQLGEFNEQNYEKLKKMRNQKRYYIHWRNSEGRDCKAIGVATKCFCDHRLKEHNYLDIGEDRQIKCKVSKCTCKHFYYVPIHGSQDFRCLCKHSYRDHKNQSKKCGKCKCEKFDSRWSCSCKLQFPEHQLHVENREEREKEGRFVSQVEGMMQQDFMDLVDYSDKYESRVDKVNEMRKMLGPNQQQIEPQKKQKKSKILSLYSQPHSYNQIFLSEIFQPIF